MVKLSIKQFGAAALLLAGVLGAIASLINANIWNRLFSGTGEESTPTLAIAATMLVWLVLPWLAIFVGLGPFLAQLKFLERGQNIFVAAVAIFWLATELLRQSGKENLYQYWAYNLFGVELPGSFLIPLALIAAAVLGVYAITKESGVPVISRNQVLSALTAIAGLTGLSVYLQNFNGLNDYFKGIFTTEGQSAWVELVNLLVAPLLLLAFGILRLIPKVTLPSVVVKYGPITLTTLALVAQFSSYLTNRYGWLDVPSVTPDPMEPLGVISSIAYLLSYQPLPAVAICLTIGLAFHAVYKLSNPGPAATFRARVSGLRKFLNALVDSKLDNFISRKVSGVLYIIITWLTIWGGYLEATYGLSLVIRGNFGGLAILILMPVALVFTLVLVRMVFESAVALIAVAENTKK